MTLNDYLNLFPAYSREKPRFSALAEAVLRQATDLIALIPNLESGFSVDSAAGTQLDALGASFFTPRQLGWDDETYRKVLLRKLKLNTWDGSNETSFDYLEEGETFCDNVNGTVTVRTPSPLPAEGMLPVPMGVKKI